MTPEDYELGEEVTNVARPSGRPMTAVLSLRVDYEMMGQLEQAATAEDRSILFVARLAIQEWLQRRRRHYDVTLTEEEGAALEKRLASPPPALSRPARHVVTLTETPPWLTTSSGSGHNFYTPRVTP